MAVTYTEAWAEHLAAVPAAEKNNEDTACLADWKDEGEQHSNKNTSQGGRSSNQLSADCSHKFGGGRTFTLFNLLSNWAEMDQNNSKFKKPHIFYFEFSKVLLL